MMPLDPNASAAPSDDVFEAEDTEYSLAAAMDKLYADTSIVDPDEFADLLMKTIPPNFVRQLLRKMLRDHVRIYFGSRRQNRNRGSPTPEMQTPPRSWKFEVASWLLRESVSVGDQFKALGDCGLPDIDFLVNHRRKLATENTAAAEFYERIGSAMRKHKAARVADLPEKVIRSFEKESDK